MMLLLFSSSSLVWWTMAVILWWRTWLLPNMLKLCNTLINVLVFSSFFSLNMDLLAESAETWTLNFFESEPWLSFFHGKPGSSPKPCNTLMLVFLLLFHSFSTCFNRFYNVFFCSSTLGRTSWAMDTELIWLPSISRDPRVTTIFDSHPSLRIQESYILMIRMVKNSYHAYYVSLPFFLFACFMINSSILHE